MLLEGCAAHALKYAYTDQVAVWTPQYALYEKMISKWKQHERTTSKRPHRAIQTRFLRSKRYIPHDRSTDIRRY